MGCSSSDGQNNNKNANTLPLKINPNEIFTIIFNFEGKARISIITLPFFRLGNLFLQSLLKNQNTEMYDKINKYKFFYKARNISNYFYQNEEAKVLNVKTQSIEITVTESSF